MVVNCVNVIPSDKQDKHILEKMYAEREGIIQKAVKALQTVIKNGHRYSEPEKVKLSRKEYMQTNNSVISFWNECITEINSDNNSRYTTGQIFDVYKSWCKDNNSSKNKDAKEFRNDISKHLGVEYNRLVVHKIQGNFYKNYTLKEDVVEHYIKHYNGSVKKLV